MGAIAAGLLLAAYGTSGSGKVTTESRSVEPFDARQTNDGANVDLEDFPTKE